MISKLFEMAIKDRFARYFTTSDHQFGFKKNLSCQHAIYCVRNVVDSFVSNQSTVNICALDLSKAFDRVNHFALFIKLMERQVPISLLNIFETWFGASITCVKWGKHISKFVKLIAGVRQGGVLSPVLFAVFINDLVDEVNRANIGCYISNVCVSIVLYADDIMLIAPSITGLQRLLTICEEQLILLDMRINVNKSVCIRFGHRYNESCVELNSMQGGSMKWVKSCRYLGVYLESARTFKCSFDLCKSKFFRAFNALFSKIGRAASEDVVLALLRTKCLPILLYSTEACPVLSRDKHSIDFAITRVFMKVFCTNSASVVAECQRNFNFLPFKLQLSIRTAKFLQRFSASENLICSIFSANASNQLNCLFSKYGERIVSVSQLINAIYARNE